MRIFISFFRAFLCLIFWQTGFSIYAQELPVVFKIADAETNTPLLKAHIYIEDIEKNLVADFDGKAHTEIKAGGYHAVVKYIGYETKYFYFEIEKKEQVVEIALSPATLTIEEVTVNAEAENAHTHSVDIGSTSIKAKEIQDLPFLMGEADPLKSIQYLPGVQASGEGNGGIFVRGGSLDQNLILYDNAPIYNPNHLFGFFSVFNVNSISQFDIMKGGIPAHFGGRLSSVLNIKSRKASNTRKAFKGNVGFLAGSFAAELPVVKNKSSLLVSARRTYADLILKGLSSSIDALNNQPDYYFYDVNINYDHQLSSKDRFSFVFYRGKDDFAYQQGNSFRNTIAWANTTGAFNWKHAFNSSFVAEASFYFSDYKMELGAGINNYNLNLNSGIRDVGGKLVFSLDKNEKASTQFGTEIISRRFTPNNIALSSSDTELDVPNTATPALYGLEVAAFMNHKKEIGRFLVNAGLRVSAFAQLGPFTRYAGNDNNVLLDSVNFNKGDIVASYSNVEPRLAIRYKIDEHNSLKTSIDRTAQYVHLAPISSVSLPTDIWVPSSENIRPQSAWQVALGYFKTLGGGAWETSATVYHKLMQNQLEYRNGVIFGYGTGYNFDDNFTFGKGHSTGLELFLKKHEGRLTGWLAYTLSRTTRRFEEIDSNRPFPAKYDRLHDLSLVGNYQLSKKWKISTVFVLASGNTLTLPTGRYLIEGRVVNDYGTRNNFRMPAYHRWDISATLRAGKKDSYSAWWVFSIYNLYNRQNPYYLYFDVSGNAEDYNLDIEAKKVSLFPILPSISYRFEF